MGLTIVFVVIGILGIIVLGMFAMVMSWYKKIPQGEALIRTGRGGTQVAFEKGMFVIPVLHMVEKMDLSVKTIEITRLKEDGLICKDNLRADIKVVFFVRVNPIQQDIVKVAQTIGCERASNHDTLRTLFEAKFSEALKTAGKRFDFVKLYDNREEFKTEVLETVGSDLNGYLLDDAAIDYLEQTSIKYLSEDNILDSEGIKKITELTAIQKIRANHFRREEEKTIKEQNVEAQEAILEYERQLSEKQERQKREIANIKAREEAEIAKINEEERLRSETVRIRTEEELAIANENMQRQIIVASKNKMRTEVVETERVEKDRLLEVTERERIVTLAEIEKERAIEEEKKSIQDVIRERIMVEKKVVEEEEKIKDTKELASANRAKQVAIIQAEETGEALVIEATKIAESERLSAEIQAKRLVIDAEAKMNAASKEAEARKINAEAKAAEEASIGLSEAQVTEAKAEAKEREGSLEAIVIEKKALAEAKGIEAKAAATHKQGMLQAEVLSETGQAEAKVIELKALAAAKGTEQQGLSEARVMGEKLSAEAKGVEEKALAMQKLDGVGREHEEFKLRLEKEKAIDLAQINIQQHIAEAQAKVLAEAFKHAKIDIVGGEDTFINNIMNAVGRSKTLDRFVNNSETIGELKGALLNGESNGNGASGLLNKIGDMVKSAGMSSEDVKNLTMAALLLKLRQNASGTDKDLIGGLMDRVKAMGLGGETVGKLL